MACFDNFFIILLGALPGGSCTVRNEACAGRCLGLFVLHSVEMKSLFPFVTIINNFWYLLGEEWRSSLWPAITPHTQIIIISKTMMIESRSLCLSAFVASWNCFMSENCWFATALDFVPGFNVSLVASMSPAVSLCVSSPAFWVFPSPYVYLHGVCSKSFAN